MKTPDQSQRIKLLPTLIHSYAYRKSDFDGFLGVEWSRNYPNQGDTNRVIGHAKTKKFTLDTGNIEYNIFGQ